MEAQLSNNNLSSLLSIVRAPIVKKLSFLLSIAASVALGIALYMWVQDPLYQPIDYSVNQQNISTLIDILEKAGVQYKINERDGTILVAAKDIQNARMKIAAAGIVKDGDEFNFAYLNEKEGLGSTQFLENARYLRALENDLAKTISAIQGVQAAKVHIAISQKNTFADENVKPTASVVLTLAPGYSSDKEKIRAIVQIVSSSVPDLDPNNVSITDQYGHFLSSLMEQSSLYNAEQLNFQNNIQNYYEKRIESMITPLLGENKVSVRVYANIDFTQTEVANEQYDPDRKVIRSEQTVKEENGSSGASGVPGSLSDSAPSSGGEQQSNSNNSSQNQSRNETVKNYEIGKSVSYTKSNYAKIKSLSVAVVVDDEAKIDPNTKKPINSPIYQDKINKITELVKTTIGYDESRGDKVTVVNSNFASVPKPEPVVTAKLWEQPWFWDLVKKVLGILIGAILIFIILRNIIKFLKSSPPPKTEGNLLLPSSDGDSYQLTTEMMLLKQQQLEYLKELTIKEPAKVRNIIKNWVNKKSDG